MPTPEITLSPFDSIAEDYDKFFTMSLIGKLQREAVWRESDNIFNPGQLILELNCGTGEDAVHFAEHGLSLVAIDKSSRMLEIAQHRVNKAGYPRQVLLQHTAIEDIRPATSLLRFDGAFSNFGGLNCVADLGQVAQDLARCLKPGSPVLLCLMNRYCLWEWLYYLSRFELKKAFRRLSEGGITAYLDTHTPLHVYYPRISELIEIMQPHFRYIRHKAVGLAVPPSYLEVWGAKHPSLLSLANKIDSHASPWAGVRNLGDHYLVHVVRC